MALLNPPFPYYASSQPPLGLAYLTSVSKMEGVDVKIIDANAERLSLKEITERILEYKPEILGITMSTPVFDVAVKISKAVKREIPVFILAGGPHPSTLPEETLGSGAIDIVCRGEGEETLTEVFDYFLKEKPLEKISGISFLNKGESVSTPDRPPIKREGRFLFEKWGELGTYEKAVFEHGNLTADLINRKFREAYRKFYLRPNFIIRKIKGIKRLKDIKNLLSGFSVFIKLETKKSI